MTNNPTLAIVGLGYVGLPLAVEFGKVFSTVGFDTNRDRIAALKKGIDKTLEVSTEALTAATRLQFTEQATDLLECTVFIITVPTPVDRHKRPDLGPLLSASSTVAQLLKVGDVVIFESTVYPGATEEACVPLLERESGLSFNRDFTVGYSPERVNPGDKEHCLSNVVKIVSGSTVATADFVESLYQRIITAGTHKTSSIRVAEAAKVIENTQRDINIALMNELAMIFNRLGIDTQEVLAAAGSKWNFLKFQPGLVGGHCIGVDPYYLTHKAQEIGYFPEIILAGRRINDMMGSYVTNRVLQAMICKNISLVNANILVMGLTFKENCTDMRNSRVIDIVRELQNFNLNVTIHDPWADPEQATADYQLTLCADPEEGRYHAIIVAVAHQTFIDRGIDSIRTLGVSGAVIFDVKHVFPTSTVDGQL